MRSTWPMLLAFAATTASGAQSQIPYTPADDSVVLEHVYRAMAAGVETLRQMQAALVAEPHHLDAALKFARAAITAGREEADPRYFGYAESALQPWWNDAHAPASVVLLRATVLQWRHDFDGARKDLDAVIAADGDGADQAHLTRAVVLMVQGEPAAAVRDCADLIGHTDLLTAGTCITAANSLRGRPQASLDALTGMLRQTPSDDPGGVRIWAETEAAEIAVRLGQTDTARGFYQQALQGAQASGHRDPYLLTSYADFLLDQNQPAEVVALLSGLTRIDNLLLRLALAERLLAQQGDAGAARELATHAQELQQRFDETRQRGDFVHQREEALFLLHIKDQPAAALRVAAENWQKQREPTDARVFLEAAQAAQQAAAAQPVLLWMKQTGLEDQRLQSLAAQLAVPETQP